MDANQQIAIRLLQAIDEKDWEGVSGAFAADAEYRPPAQQARVGRAAIERYYREERPVILGLHRVDEILSGDGITVVTGEFVGESQGGRRTCAKFIDILRIHDGAIIDREVMTRPLGETPFQPPLVTDRLLLRPFTLTDVEGLVRIGEGGFIADTTITVPHPLSTESARHWLIDDLTRCSRAQKIYAVEDRISSTLVGSVGFRHIDEAHRQGELTFGLVLSRLEGDLRPKPLAHSLNTAGLISRSNVLRPTSCVAIRRLGASWRSSVSSGRLF